MHAEGATPSASSVTSKLSGTQMPFFWATHGSHITIDRMADVKGQRPSMGKARHMMVPGFQRSPRSWWAPGTVAATCKSLA